jgi:Zn-dependent M28 family amino/carboxypeptidase
MGALKQPWVAVPLFAASLWAANPLAEQWLVHLRALSSDEMRGRETGSPEHRKAAQYIATQFEKAGLKPFFGNSYLQPVRLRSRQIVKDGTSVTLIRKDQAEQPLNLPGDITLNARIDLPKEIEAPLIFVGYGLHAPEAKHDDLAGVDVKGKIAVYINGGPSKMSGALQSHAGSAAIRWDAFAKAGAVGILSIANPANMDIPWERSSPSSFQPSMSLGEPALDDSRLIRFGASLNPARAEALLFAGAEKKFSYLLSLADLGKPLPHFDLPVRLRAKVNLRTSELESQNVAGVVMGTEPVLEREYLFVTGHLDHLGVGPAINGDSIYNGTMDNASGIASLIEIARDIAAKPLRRNVVFAAVTAEEKGLLGSRYLAAHSGLPTGAIIGDINSDMFLPLYPMKVLTAIGMNESTFRAPLDKIAKRYDIKVEDDPEPKRNLFVRSDQYNFVRTGVPAIALKIGFKLGSPEHKTQQKWLTERYHAPSDDLNQPMDLDAAARFIEVTTGLVREVGNSGERPRWNPDSFFSRFSVK